MKLSWKRCPELIALGGTISPDSDGASGKQTHDWLAKCVGSAAALAGRSPGQVLSSHHER